MATKEPILRSPELFCRKKDTHVHVAILNQRHDLANILNVLIHKSHHLFQKALKLTRNTTTIKLYSIQ